MFKKSIPSRLVAGFSTAALVAFLFAIGSVINVGAATAPTLGAAASYAVLGGQTVTNTGPTTIDGDLGVSPGTATPGFPPGIVSGSIHSADAHAALAQDATTTAYNALASQPCDTDLTGQDLGGLTLTQGVYCFSSSAQLTGLLQLDAEGSADAVFIFQIGSTLTTASNSTVDVINGGVDCNVFWQVGSSATIGTTTTFVGNVLALTSITLTTGASVSGRVLARNGAVTLDSNNVDFLACAAATATPSPAPTDSPTAPATATAAPTPPPTPTPVGQTPSPTPSATPQPPTGTATPQPPTGTATPQPPTGTATPQPPTGTATPQPPTGTPQLPSPPAPTNTPSPTPGVPTRTPEGPLPPEKPVVPGFPNTGGAPPEDGLPWATLLAGMALAGFGAITTIVSRRTARLNAERSRS